MLLRTVACQSRACRAFCSPFSVLRSPGRKAPLSCTPGTSATCQLACPTGDSGDAGNAGAPFRTTDGTVLYSGVSRRPIRPIGPMGPTALFGACQDVTEMQGVGTVERPVGPNGEVPSPLHYFVFSWERDALTFQASKLPSFQSLMGPEGVEPSRREAQEPKSCVSANSTTSPNCRTVYHIPGVAAKGAALPPR